MYTLPVQHKKSAVFCGSALSDLQAFPKTARVLIGHQIDLVQDGQEPTDWKPMKAVGKGVREVRVRDASGAFRVIYVAKFVESIYILHCFQKKSQKTAKADVDLARDRYEQLLRLLQLPKE
jgi:phage-related protein